MSQATLVSDRAERWTLDGPDLDFMERQKYFWNPLMDYWFRMEVERLGADPGAAGAADRDPLRRAVRMGRLDGRRAVVASLRPQPSAARTAHDALMAFPVLGSYFRRMGVLPAGARQHLRGARAGHDVALWPGGERDSLRRGPSATRRSWPDAKASSARDPRGVPIVPIATVGGPDSMPVLATGRRWPRPSRLDKSPG